MAHDNDTQMYRYLWIKHGQRCALPTLYPQTFSIDTTTTGLFFYTMYLWQWKPKTDHHHQICFLDDTLDMMMDGEQQYKVSTVQYNVTRQQSPVHIKTRLIGKPLHLIFLPVKVNEGNNSCYLPQSLGSCFASALASGHFSLGAVFFCLFQSERLSIDVDNFRMMNQSIDKRYHTRCIREDFTPLGEGFVRCHQRWPFLITA